MALIYKITNKQNGKVYIGQTKFTLQDRLCNSWCGHFIKADNGYDNALCNALRKYGKDNFTYEVIEERNDFTSNEELINWLDSRETHWISYYQSTNPNIGYNRTTGGHIRNHPTKETKLKISEGTKRGMSSLRVRKKLSEAKRGISPSNKGVPMSDETRQKISIGTKLAFQRDDVKQNHKLAMNDPIVRKKMQETKIQNGTNRHSEEHCRKISESKKGCRWMTNGVTSKVIRPEDTELLLSKGWSFGRALNNAI